MPSDYQRMIDIITYLKQNADRQPPLTEIAARLSLSPGYLQRLFRRYTGISPKRYLQHLTSSKARQLLDQSASILETSFASGLSSPSRLHDLLVAVEAVTPGEVRSKGENLHLRYGMHPTPFGSALIGVTSRGICRLDFFDDDGISTLKQLHKDWPNAQLTEDSDATATIVKKIFAPMLNEPANPLILHLHGTNFQLKVWQALLHIPPGCLAAYRQIAEKIGQPTAARAVGQAIGQNPICYLIPCHRVLRGDGSIGGYRGGLQRKEVLLAVETCPANLNNIRLTKAD